MKQACEGGEAELGSNQETQHVGGVGIDTL